MFQVARVNDQIINEEDRWLDVVGIWLRINKKCYNEIFNRSMSVGLNLAVYLVKYLKKRPSIAEKEAYYAMYALFKESLQAIVQTSSYVLEGDIFDLVRLKNEEKGFNVDDATEIVP